MKCSALLQRVSRLYNILYEEKHLINFNFESPDYPSVDVMINIHYLIFQRHESYK